MLSTICRVQYGHIKRIKRKHLNQKKIYLIKNKISETSNYKGLQQLFK